MSDQRIQWQAVVLFIHCILKGSRNNGYLIEMFFHESSFGLLLISKKCVL